MIDFILSRLKPGEKELQVITIGKRSSLNKEWEKTFAADAEVIQR
jgi:hypothetical protein